MSEDITVHEVQVAMLQIGVVLGEFLDSPLSVSDLDQAAEILLDNLGVTIRKHDDILTIRDHIISAVEERDSIAKIYDEMNQVLMEEMQDEIQSQLDENLDDAAKASTSRFDNAMDIL